VPIVIPLGVYTPYLRDASVKRMPPDVVARYSGMASEAIQRFSQDWAVIVEGDFVRYQVMITSISKQGTVLLEAPQEIEHWPIKEVLPLRGRVYTAQELHAVLASLRIERSVLHELEKDISIDSWLGQQPGEAHTPADATIRGRFVPGIKIARIIEVVQIWLERAADRWDEPAIESILRGMGYSQTSRKRYKSWVKDGAESCGWFFNGRLTTEGLLLGLNVISPAGSSGDPQATRRKLRLTRDGRMILRRSIMRNPFVRALSGVPRFPYLCRNKVAAIMGVTTDYSEGSTTVKRRASDVIDWLKWVRGDKCG